MSILVLNAGSSTLKFALFADAGGETGISGTVDWKGGAESADVTLRGDGRKIDLSNLPIANCDHAVNWVLQQLASAQSVDPIRAVGHRIVHGGPEFRCATLVDDRCRGALERTAALAPLHNPPALTALDAVRSALPGIANVAVFDTSFFANMSQQAIVYPVPYDWYEQYGIRRFGFHGISHAYCAGRAAELLGRENDDSLRLVICHLGNGCSATATRSGHAINTTMGFTPLEGLMMGTRSGSIDPGVLFYLQQQQGLTVAELEQALLRQSGLLGVSGVSSDYRQVEQAAEQGHQRAQLALDLFADRVRAAIGALAVTLGGVDAVVFTGGIGENSPQLRRQVCIGLGCLGAQLDDSRNEQTDSDSDIALDRSPARVLVIHTREELKIAIETLRLIEASKC